jgi:hypothetical protein
MIQINNKIKKKNSMKNLKTHLLESINEAKTPSPEIQAIIDLFEEIKLNQNLNVTYSVSGSGKSIAGKFRVSKPFNEGFVLTLESGMSFERGNLSIYVPNLKLVKDDVYIFYENKLTNIDSGWSPSFPTKKKRTEFIVDPENYNHIVEATKNIEPNMKKLEKSIEKIIKDYDSYKTEAEEAAAKRSGMSHKEFLAEYKEGTDAYRTSVVPELKSIISEVINKDCKNAINKLL